MIIIIALTLVMGLLVCLAAWEHWTGPCSTLLMVLTAVLGLVLALILDGLNWVECRLRRCLTRLEEGNR